MKPAPHPRRASLSASESDRCAAWPPRATYRLQLGPDFDFARARRLVPYLARLGISHLYLSPVLKARRGSAHGYDIVDHSRFNPELGDEQTFAALVDRLHRFGMGLIIDFVPNHMAIGTDNPWWADILEWGAASEYAPYFDIDWRPLESTLRGKVLLPLLGDHYGNVLERGELTLQFDTDDGSFCIDHQGTGYPVAVREYPALLRGAVELHPQCGPALRPVIQALTDAFAGRSGRARMRQRREAAAAQKARLAACAVEVDVAAAIDELVGRINAPGDTDAPYAALHRLLKRQYYRLAYWRVAAHEINYRRFFDINDLAGLRIERPTLFHESHSLIVSWLKTGMIDGVRLDHVDGLRDPADYFRRLQRLAHRVRPATGGAGGRVSAEDTGKPLYLVVEKLLAPHESLRPDWAVHGTTGYDFLRTVNGLFVDPDGERPLERCYRRFLGEPVDCATIEYEARRETMQRLLGSELNTLAHALKRLARRNRHTRDYTLTALREALIEVVAAFPVYRSYVTRRGASATDRRDIEWALGRARTRSRDPDRSVFDFIGEILTLDVLTSRRRRFPGKAVVDLALRVQQYTGPVVAKATEDTLFYRYVRLVSLNEVGCDPRHFAISPAAFHDAAAQRLRDHPIGLLATATHDHKRGEDGRARLNVLSERPREWARCVFRWSALNARRRSDLGGIPAPARNDEYLFYQTLVGTWPWTLDAPTYEGIEKYRERIVAYMLKAVREAKTHTSWIATHEAYEQALTKYIEQPLDPALSAPIIDDIAAFVRTIAPTGAVNGLAQVLLKLTSPGVPDLYQGCEWWDLSLVDPDNRRPVDFANRARALGRRRRPLAAQIRDWPDGALKQHLISRALSLRRELPAVFATGDYLPLHFNGPQSNRLFGFVRHRATHGVVVVIPRLISTDFHTPDRRSSIDWTGTRLECPVAVAPTLEDTLDDGRRFPAAGGRVAVGPLFERLPVALLRW